jgi:CBS domain-containing protein
MDNELFHQKISVLHPARPVVVDVRDTVESAVRVMQDRKIGCVLVVTKDRLAGIFTERDVLTKVLRKGFDAAHTAVEMCMTPEPETLRDDDTVACAVNRMHLGGYRHLPIVDEEGTPVGVISVKDIIDELAMLYPEEVLNPWNDIRKGDRYA